MNTIAKPKVIEFTCDPGCAYLEADGKLALMDCNLFAEGSHGKTYLTVKGNSHYDPDTRTLIKTLYSHRCASCSCLHDNFVDGSELTLGDGYE